MTVLLIALHFALSDFTSVHNYFLLFYCLFTWSFHHLTVFSFVLIIFFPHVVSAMFIVLFLISFHSISGCSVICQLFHFVSNPFLYFYHDVSVPLFYYTTNFSALPTSKTSYPPLQSMICAQFHSSN